MRSSASPRAVRIKTGAAPKPRTHAVRLSPSSPGIMTSTIRRSKSSVAISLRAAAASAAVVTRNPARAYRTGGLDAVAGARRILAALAGPRNAPRDAPGSGP